MYLNSYQLKYIALIAMIIDHMAIVFRTSMSHTLYLLLRGIGRQAFPIFCFLLVEGFLHTRSRSRYLARLLLFSILSELPYDLALQKTYRILGSSLSTLRLMDWSEQNVFFTLALGLLAMMLLDRYRHQTVNTLAIIVGLPCLAEWLHTDYGSIGVLTIILFYLYRRDGRIPLWFCYLPLLLLILDFQIQVCCIASYLLIQTYNGEQGRGNRYLFYIAYPLHLLLLCALHMFLL